MKVIDTNILIYAVNESSPNFDKASVWWRDALNADDPIGIPWISALACVRILTNGSLFENPLTMEQGLDLVEGWLSYPQVNALNPTVGHLHRVRTLLTTSIPEEISEANLKRHNLLNDAHIAALAIEHGGTVFTADSDFKIFTQVKSVNPLNPT
jgi:toxin-antitoxin system PIN domain toxin